MDELIDEKTKVVLNLIRTNNSADEALKLTQALVNISNAKCILLNQGSGKPTRTKGAGA